MTFEQRVRGALRAADDYEPSGDLFAKVRRSIEEDRLHRRRVAKVLAWVATGVVAIGIYLWATLDVVDGVWTMSYRALEILVTVVMIGLVLVMGPTIRRFGQLYEQHVFASGPDTGRRVLRLLDIAYYLVLGAFVIITLQFEPPTDFNATLPGWLEFQKVRLGGLLLVMGLLHAGLIVTLPVVGLIHAANSRRIRIAGGAESRDRWLDRLDGAITVVAWVLAGLLILQVVGAVLNGLVLLGGSG